MDKWIEFIKENDIGKYITNADLKRFNTYKIGKTAYLVVYPKDTQKLIKLMKFIKSNSIKYKVLGNGSNVIFNEVYDGILIKLDCFNKCTFINNKVKVGAGYNLIKLSREVAKKSLAGLEFASGIPGTIGGAVYMNAGAYKSDMGYIVENIKVLTPDFKIIIMTNKEIKFKYRTSFLKSHPDYICIEATLKLTKGNKEKILEVINERKNRRLESQPLEYPSAGSVFRNPEGMFAGKLIEDLGFKGLTKGGAQVSNKHANFIINIGNAKPEDVKELIEFIKDAVKERYGVELKVEQEFVNWE